MLADADIKAFAAALRRHASPRHWLLLALVDQGFIDMALSFYIGSLKPHNITNYLMIATDAKTCDALAAQQVRACTHTYNASHKKIMSLIYSITAYEK